MWETCKDACRNHPSSWKGVWRRLTASLWLLQQDLWLNRRCFAAAHVAHEQYFRFSSAGSALQESSWPVQFNDSHHEQHEKSLSSRIPRKWPFNYLEKLSFAKSCSYTKLASKENFLKLWFFMAYESWGTQMCYKLQLECHAHVVAQTITAGRRLQLSNDSKYFYLDQ